MKEKIKERMFKLHRHKSLFDKSREKFDFSFSNIQALQIPKGWDKLYISLISVETKKTIAKSGKASVQNGSCQWTETLLESIWISQDDVSKELGQCLFKLLVAMGSSRSGILGEATVNLAGYMSSKTSIPTSLPLKNCKHGTILQVDIQCLTPRTNQRNDEWRGTHSCMEDANAEYDDMENKSDVSDCTFTKSVESTSSYHLGNTSHLGELDSRGASFSASGSHRSFDSMGDSSGRESCSPRSNLSGFVNNVIGRQDSTDSQISTPLSSYTGYDSPRSNYSSSNSGISSSGRLLQNQKEDIGKKSLGIPTPPLRNAGSSKSLVEAEEITIKELRAEARMWERNARKLMLDVEILNKKFDEQSKHLTNLDMELSASHNECEGLKREIEHRKTLLDESTAKQEATQNLMLQAKDMDYMTKELEDEIRFQKQSNDNLAMQLKKTQESNLELVSVLQEMEETIEKQKTEIENLSMLKLKFVGKEKHIHEDDGEVIRNQEILMRKMEEISFMSDLGSSTVAHQKIELHANFEPEDNSNSELQLQRLQESQKNLEQTILYLEKFLEEKSHEIEIERELKNRSLLDCEAKWRGKITVKEEEIIDLEAKLSQALNAQESKELDSESRDNLSLINEIETLKEKVQELERDCNELTEENLELLFKLKESKSYCSTSTASFDSSSNEGQGSDSSRSSDSEVSKLRSQIWHLKQEMEKNVGMTTSSLQIKCSDLEDKCMTLEIQLQASKDKANYLDGELQKCRAKAEEKEIEIDVLQQQLQNQQGEQNGGKGPPADVCATIEKYNSQNVIDIYGLYPALSEQLQHFLVNVNKQQCILHSPGKNGCKFAVENLGILGSVEPTTQEDQAKIMLKQLVHLNNLFETKFCVRGDLQCGAEENAGIRYAHEVQNEMAGDNMKNNILHASSLVPHCLNKELESPIEDLGKELLAETSEISKLKADHLLKGRDIKALSCCQVDLETQISDLQYSEYKDEHMETMQREGRITSNCLCDSRNDMMVLNSCMDSHISVNKILERKSLELENSNRELEINLSELEKENVQLSERICGLEAQLRYLTDARESICLELRNSESHVMNLQDEISKAEGEMETQKLDMKDRLLVMQSRWLEAQEECEYLKKANSKLQATTESLIEECSSLQKSNEQLRQQRLELHENCVVLEAELRRSQDSVSDSLKKIEDLEAKFSSMVDNITSKERFFGSELDALYQENREHKQKLAFRESSLNQMYSEKEIEVENLQREIEHLGSQFSATHDDKEIEASKFICEMHTLCAEKDKLEAALQQDRIKVEMSETKLQTIQVKYEAEVQGLMNELATSKGKQEFLMAKNEKLLGLLNNVKSDDNKLRGIIDELESKLRSSEYEKMLLREEISSLKVQFPKIAILQDEVLALKSSLSEMKFENERLEASFQLLSRDYEVVKTERTSLVQQISSMQKALSELEECRKSKIVLEEKTLRLEGDLTAKEALCAQEAELKNELGRIRRTNSQFQWNIKCLEEEKKDCLMKVTALEEELKQMKQVKQDQGMSSPIHSPLAAGCNNMDKINNVLILSKNDAHNPISFSKDQPPPSVKTAQLQPFLQCQDNQEMVQKQIQFDNMQYSRSFQETAVDPATRIMLLENELVEALEANGMYKAQLQSYFAFSLLSERQTSHLDAPKKFEVKDEAINREEKEQKASLLEAELREIRERYLDMSLKYAEVEAQREQLVMELKAAKHGRKWFS